MCIIKRSKLAYMTISYIKCADWHSTAVPRKYLLVLSGMH